MNKTNQLELEKIFNETRILVESGDYESAKDKLSYYWDEIGKYPNTKGLSDISKANLLLLTGALTGWIGSAKQIHGTQEVAKDLISEASDIFENLDILDRWAESRGELAACYWREGAFSEAKIVLQDALNKTSNSSPNVKGLLLLRLVNVEISTYNYRNAQTLLNQASTIVAEKGTPLLCGKIYFHYALVMRRLAEDENRLENLADSLKYYKIAGSYYNTAHHMLYEAMVENNIGNVLCELGEFEASKKALEKALEYFTNVSDKGKISMVRDSQAKLFLAKGQLEKAEEMARYAVDIVKQGDEQSFLAEYTTTLGVILARKGDFLTAKETFIDASDIAYKIGDVENSGNALLTLIEELEHQVPANELLEYYLKADKLLTKSPRKAIIFKLNIIAKKLLLTKPIFSKSKNNDTEESFFVGISDKTNKLISKAKTFATTNECIFLVGEPGTGKKTLARQIHNWSNINGNFITLNCAFFDSHSSHNNLFPILQENNFTFTNRKSLDLPDQGTIYISEIDKLQASDQARLFHILENIQTYSKSENNTHNLRFIISSFENLEELVNKNLFRKDLYYKLNTFKIDIPCFRERKEDIPVITKHILKKHHPMWVNKMNENFYKFIEKNPLYGNGHELKLIIDMNIWNLKYDQISTCNNDIQNIKAIKKTLSNNWSGFSLPEAVKNFEAELITKALQESEGKITKAAKLLGITHQNLSAHLKNRHKNLNVEKKPRKKRTLTS